MKIAICVGHNNKYQGAVGILNITEYEFNSKLAKDILEHNFSKHELKIFKRPPIKSYKKQMKNLIKKLDKWEADLAIELHFNSYFDVTVKGHEVLYCSKNKLSKKYAKLFDKNFDMFLLNKDRNLKSELDTHRGIRFLCQNRPAIILEPFFAYHQDKYKFGREGYSRLLGSILITLHQIKDKNDL